MVRYSVYPLTGPYSLYLTLSFPPLGQNELNPADQKALKRAKAAEYAASLNMQIADKAAEKENEDMSGDKPMSESE